MELCLNYGQLKFIRVWASLVIDPQLAGLIAWRSEQRWHTTMARGTTVFIPARSSLDRWLLIGAQPRSCLSSIEHVPLCHGGTWRAKVTKKCCQRFGTPVHSCLRPIKRPWAASMACLWKRAKGREGTEDDSYFNRAHMSNCIYLQRWKVELACRQVSRNLSSFSCIRK